MHHAVSARRDFLDRLNAECFKEHLEKGRHGPKQNAIEFAFNDVVVPELIQVQADDIEESIGDQRKTIQEQNFFEAPSSDC